MKFSFPRGLYLFVSVLIFTSLLWKSLFHSYCNTQHISFMHAIFIVKRLRPCSDWEVLYHFCWFVDWSIIYKRCFWLLGSCGKCRISLRERCNFLVNGAIRMHLLLGIRCGVDMQQLIFFPASLMETSAAHWGHACYSWFNQLKSNFFLVA